MKTEVRPATIADIPEVIAGCRLREQDALAKLNGKANDYLRQVIENCSECWTGLIDDEIVCLWGIDRGTMLGGGARIWFISMAAIERHPFVFVRHSQIRLAELRKRYQYIYGVVEVGNEASVRWLRWLGFNLSDTEWVSGYALKKFSLVS